MTYDVSARPLPIADTWTTEIWHWNIFHAVGFWFRKFVLPMAALGTLCPSGQGQKRTKKRGCKSRAIGPWENLGLFHLRLMGPLWHATDSYLPQLNTNDSKQKVKQHGDQHDIPDGFHGYKHALNHMLYKKKKTILMGRRCKARLGDIN